MMARILGVSLLVLLAGTAEARAIRIDQGNNWGESLIADVAGGGTQLVDIGFAINFGSGLVDSLTINENSFVSFADGSSITALTGEFRSDPLAADVEDEGAVSYTQGIFDLAVTFDPGVDTPDAFRVQWIDQSNRHVTQILLLDMGGGDFDLEINHGCDDRPRCDDITPIGFGAEAGFSLGADSLNLPGPFALDDNLSYQFRGGRLVPTAVPGPAPLGLILLGMLLLGATRAGTGRSFD